MNLFGALLILFSSLHVGADELVRVNINRQNPEGLCFAKTDKPEAESLCDFTDDDIQSTKPITADERRNLLLELDRLLPKATGDARKATCRMPVEVTRTGETKLYCFEDLTSKQRLAFRAWFKKTRQRLAKK